MNATQLPRAKKKTYTLAEANAMLPLLRSILRDVTTLANDLRDRAERLHRLQSVEGRLDAAHQEEVEKLTDEFENGKEKMQAFVQELEELDVELKDYFSGLIDFRHIKEGREVYLCWRLGESEVAHWHELNSGFAGRKKLEHEDQNG